MDIQNFPKLSTSVVATAGFMANVAILSKEKQDNESLVAVVAIAAITGLAIGYINKVVNGSWLLAGTVIVSFGAMIAAADQNVQNSRALNYAYCAMSNKVRLVFAAIQYIWNPASFGSASDEEGLVTGPFRAYLIAQRIVPQVGQGFVDTPLADLVSRINWDPEGSRYRSDIYG